MYKGGKAVLSDRQREKIEKAIDGFLTSRGKETFGNKKEIMKRIALDEDLSPEAVERYTANYIKIEALADDAAGSATTITFTTTCEDAAADTANPTHPTADHADLDIVQGSFVATWVVKQPATAVLSNTWGTPTMSGSVAET